MGKSKEITDKALYGLVLFVIVPVILILWAKFTKNIVTIPLPVNLLSGYILLITGAIFVCSGICDLRRRDNRLPVNAFPLKRFIKNGIHGFTGQPIFFGASLISFGLSAITRSASGFWLVSPVFILLMAAYATGFKNDKTQFVFGAQDNKPFLSLPSTSDIMPSFRVRLSTYFLVFVPWLIIYKSFIFIGAPDDAIKTNLPFEEHIPIWEFSTVFYSFAFLFSLLIPLVVKTSKQLKNFITDVWFTIIFVGIIYLAFPLIIKQKEFIPHSFLGHIILYERSVDGESGALPSCHVIWAFLAAIYFSRSFFRFKWIWFSLAVLISLSCITVGAHSILDVVAGFCTFIIIIYRQNIWDYLRIQSERLSNSLRHWRIGPLRVINHSFYSGAAGFTGALLTGFFLGRQYVLVGFFILIFVISVVRLLTMLVEGSLQLLRPFIYLGGLISGIIACILANIIFSIDIFILLASFVMAAPWVDSIGGLRCLVKGCCHGKPSNEKFGIRSIHPDSMVNKTAGLSGVPLHPTQLYSIGINIITGLILIRLFNIEASSSFIVGIYLIFKGTGLFVIESFHGDAKMPLWTGMKVSQWKAILYVLSGIIFTAVPKSAVLVFQPDFMSLILAIGMGILVTLVFGVDIPESDRHLTSLSNN
jgi:membrane-associated phospholipid phosphatase